MTGGEQINCQRIRTGINAERVLRAPTAHHANHTVRTILKRIQHGEMRRKFIQEHHE